MPNCEFTPGCMGHSMPVTMAGTDPVSHETAKPDKRAQVWSSLVTLRRHRVRICIFSSLQHGTHRAKGRMLTKLKLPLQAMFGQASQAMCATEFSWLKSSNANAKLQQGAKLQQRNVTTKSMNWPESISTAVAS